MHRVQNTRATKSLSFAPYELISPEFKRAAAAFEDAKNVPVGCFLPWARWIVDDGNQRLPHERVIRIGVVSEFQEDTSVRHARMIAGRGRAADREGPNSP